MKAWEDLWFVGSQGVHYSTDGIHWHQLGTYTYPVKTLLRQGNTLFIGTEGGLWAATPENDQWQQLHDENLTEVLSLAPATNELGLIAASPYGICWPRRGNDASVQWTSYTETLPPNQRFTNVLLTSSQQNTRWLAGTEAGIIVLEHPSQRQIIAPLIHTPVRALCLHQERYWAGTDLQGIWHSDNGLEWHQSNSWKHGAIFALASAVDTLLVGTETGLIHGQPGKSWHRSALALMITAAAVDPRQNTTWLAGASPGGLWRSTDAGSSWHQSGAFQHIHTLLKPRETA